MTIDGAIGRVAFERREGVPWLVLTGAVDMFAVEPITDASLAALETDGPLYVDLREATFIDSLGVGLLLRLRQLAGEVHLVQPTREINRVLELCGVDTLFRRDAA